MPRDKDDEQDDLFGPSYPERPGSVRGCDTSIAAADSLDADALSALRARIWNFLDGRGHSGATCDEIEELLDLRHQTASARLRELFLMGRIFDSYRRRRTRSRRWARVYVTRVA